MGKLGFEFLLKEYMRTNSYTFELETNDKIETLNDVYELFSKDIFCNLMEICANYEVSFDTIIELADTIREEHMAKVVAV